MHFEELNYTFKICSTNRLFICLDYRFYAGQRMTKYNTLVLPV